MSLVDLRVELPVHSHSFCIRVPHSSSIRDVKEEISRTCPGAPRVDGQRVICRGRFLRDEEKLQDVWQSPNDVRIVHLAVHPSAWTAPPPAPSGTPSAQAPVSQPHMLHQQHFLPEMQSSSAPPPAAFANSSLAFIALKHKTAIHVLTHGTPYPNSPDPNSLMAARAYAVSVLQYHGWSWPSVLDEDYPPSDDGTECVKYERTVIDNLPYLRLSTPNATPNQLQAHALKVLAHTFPLLSVAPPVQPSPYPPYPFHNPQYNVQYPTTPNNININNHLQQLGLPQLRLVPGQHPNQNPNPNDPNNARADIRAIPLRALLMPLMMLTFRTFLLMYFFSPSKRPVFGLILSLWIIYEAWSAFRAVLGNGDNDAAIGAGAAAQPRAPDPAQGQGQQPQDAGAARRTPAGALLDRLSNMNIATEDYHLDRDAPATPPGVAHRVKTFVGLMFMTLHPAVWDRRRALLRRREGRLRTEANVRESQPPPAEEGAEGAQTGSSESSARERARAELVARHERRPRWVREYVDRIQVTEWADDA